MRLGLGDKIVFSEYLQTIINRLRRIYLMKKLWLIVPVLIIAGLGASYYLKTAKPSYSNTREITGDWIITDYQVIEDTLLNIDGSIILEGEGHLVLRNCYLNFEQEFNNEHGIQVGSWDDEGVQRVDFKDVIFDSNGKWMYVWYLGSVEAVYDNVKCKQLNIPWHMVAKNAKMTARDTDIGITFADNGTMTAVDSDLFIELVLRNCSGMYTLPRGEVEELSYEFDMGPSTMSFETTGCSFREWGVTLDYLSDIRFKDTKLTIGLNAGTNPSGEIEPVEVSGLKAGEVDYMELFFDSNILELVNCDVVSWYPQAFNGAVVDVSDSYLADVQWNTAESMVIVRDCSAYMAYAKENVTYVFYDSLINGEVTATEKSKIYLVNTEVKGKITEKDNGQVFIDEEPEWEEIDYVPAEAPPVYQNIMTVSEDWIVEDYQLIEDTMITLDADLKVLGEGKLVLRDCYLNITQDYNREHNIQVGDGGSDDSPEFTLENVHIDTNYVWMNTALTGRSKTRYENVTFRDPNMPWHGISSHAEIEVIDSWIGVTCEENARVSAVDSNVFFEIMFYNINGTYTMPRGWVEEQDYVFELGNDRMTIETTGCIFRDWGLTLDYNTSITFEDTILTIGMNAGMMVEPPEETIYLTGLKTGFYDYFEVDYHTNHLTLINSEVTYWYPQAWEGAKVEISDSDLADLQWNGGDSEVTVRDSQLQIAYSMDNVTYRIYNSTIWGEVVATDNSTIYLFDTHVEGNIRERDNGQVFIDDEPYEG